jgi:hypothetical protein
LNVSAIRLVESGDPHDLECILRETAVAPRARSASMSSSKTRPSSGILEAIRTRPRNHVELDEAAISSTER